MKGLAHGDLSANRDCVKMDGAGARSTGRVLLGPSESQGWVGVGPHIQSLVTRECQESSH